MDDLASYLLRGAEHSSNCLGASVSHFFMREKGQVWVVTAYCSIGFSVETVVLAMGRNASIVSLWFKISAFRTCEGNEFGLQQWDLM